MGEILEIPSLFVVNIITMIRDNWEQETFDNTYAEVMASLQERKDSGNMSMEDLQAVLQALCIREDNNMTGRGAIRAVEMEAEIAAHQAFLFQWKKEKAS